MSKLLLGIDVGTTNVKSVLFDLEGNIIAQGSAEYKTYIKRPGWVEQNPNDWWGATVKTILEVVSNSKVNRYDIAAIGVSSQAPTLLPVDEKGIPLRNALIWMDRRSQEYCSQIDKIISNKEIKEITGNNLDSYFLPPKVLWFKENEEELFCKTYKILQVNGYINYKLTDIFSTDSSHASLTQLCDINKRIWSSRVCNTINIPIDILPNIYEPADIIGYVTKKASEITGLPEGVPVVAGTVDAPAASLEAGIIGDGEAVEMTGTSTVVMIGSNKWRDCGRLGEMYHAINGYYLVFGAMSTTGGCLKWFRDNLGENELKCSKDLSLDVYELMDLEASKVSPGAGNLVFLPYMMGERSPIWDSYARGAFVGLNLNTSRQQIIRAILEGTSFALLHNIEEAKSVGVNVNRLKSVGGGSKSDLWLKIKASMLNLPVTVPETSTGAPYGDAIIAGTGIGIYKDPIKVAKETTKIKKIIQPDKEWNKVYFELFEIYKSLYKNVKDDLYNLAKSKNKV